jgi:hypothetical protein
MWVIADFYGVRVGTDSRLTTPEIAVPAEAGIAVHFTASDFRAAA